MREKIREMAECPSCGAALSQDARFCSACGHSLSTSDETEQRQLATVVFADLAGARALAPAEDAELPGMIPARFLRGDANLDRGRGRPGREVRGRRGHGSRR